MAVSSSQQVSESSMSNKAYDDASKQPNIDDSPRFKTKRIEFFGHKPLIILQEMNGPCSLIAICNVLLLRSEINIDNAINAFQEVSQNKLIMVIGERLVFVSERNIENDSTDRENQEKILQTAFDALPRLATGLNVNLGFTGIDAFEYKSEITLFRLLNIPIYHGWIVDPRDCDIAEAIGSAWYDDIQMERVRLMEQHDEELGRSRILGDADYAILGNPMGSSPIGNDQSPVNKRDSIVQIDIENSRKLSKAATTILVSLFCEEAKFEDGAFDSLEQTDMHVDTIDILQASNIASNIEEPVMVVDQQEVQISSLNTDSGITDGDNELSVAGSDEFFDALMDDVEEPITDSNEYTDTLTDTSNAPEIENELINSQMDKDKQSTLIVDVDSVEQPQDGKRCIFGGESTSKDEDEVLVGRPCESSVKATRVELINNFLMGNSSQLTNYGISCLQEGLEERELCILFRNNHLSTMIKYNGELYLLVTDIGYQHQSNIVWESLSEVNGDTTFVTSSFQEFQVKGNTTSGCDDISSNKNDFNDDDWHGGDWKNKKDHSLNNKSSKDGDLSDYNSDNIDFNDVGDWDNQKVNSPSNEEWKDGEWGSLSLDDNNYNNGGWHGGEWGSKDDGHEGHISDNNDLNNGGWCGSNQDNKKDSPTNKGLKDGGWSDISSGHNDGGSHGWANWKDDSQDSKGLKDNEWQVGGWNDRKDHGTNDDGWENSSEVVNHDPKDGGWSNWKSRGLDDDGGYDNWKDSSWNEIEEEDYQLALKLQQKEYEENLK